MAENERTFSKYFKALSDPSRLRILGLLVRKDLTVNEIVKAVGLAQPTVSRHLAVLREADVVTARREGQSVYYSLNKDAVVTCCDGFCDCLQVRIKAGREKKPNK